MTQTASATGKKGQRREAKASEPLAPELLKKMDAEHGEDMPEIREWKWTGNDG